MKKINVREVYSTHGKHTGNTFYIYRKMFVSLYLHLIRIGGSALKTPLEVSEIYIIGTATGL